MRLTSFAVPLLIAGIYFNACDAAQKFPVPADREQAAAQETVDSIYKTALRNAKSTPQKVALASRLFDEAVSSQSPANRFALYMTAKDLYLDADQHHKALKVLNKVESEFSFDGTGQINDVLTDASTARVDAYGRFLISFDYQDAVFRALQQGDFKLAETLAEHAEKSARKARNNELSEAAERLVKGVEELAQHQQTLKTHRDTLNSNPNDPAANLEVGQYVCLIEQKWDDGLKRLQKAGASQWSSIAGDELAASPNALKVGDAWWDIAETLPEIYQRLAKKRAGEWYDRISDMLTGLEQTKVAQRLATLNPQVNVTGRMVPPGQSQKKLASDRHKGSAASAVNTEKNIYFLEMRTAQKLNDMRVRFNAEMSGKPARSRGNISISLDGETWFKVEEWSTESCLRAENFANWNEIALESNDLLTVERVAVKFEYTGGSHGLHIYEVDLVR